MKLNLPSPLGNNPCKTGIGVEWVSVFILITDLKHKRAIGIV